MTRARQHHTLVIGGTGMLAAVCRTLADRGQTITCVARRREGFRQLEHTNVHPVLLDYRRENELLGLLQTRAALSGEFTDCLAWIHDTAPSLPFVLMNHFESVGAPLDFLHVVGSAEADPNGKSRSFANRVPLLRHVRYRQAVLGFIVTGTGARWLTDSEIAQGVLTAYDSGAPATVVGTVVPWEKRPG